ncbi:MAG: putative glycoside hydrolase, partial [Oscillospiraceae bacterium]|nr:putative glycoside hydrolase [Oscillospiraceae bacterium]
MQQKRDKDNKTKKGGAPQEPRNTAYYRSRVNAAAKPKKDSLAYLDKAKKRQLNSYVLALVVLLALMLVFGGLVFLGMSLGSLIEPDEQGDSFDNPDIDMFAPQPLPSGDESSPFFGSTSENAPNQVDISEIFYNYNGVYLDVSKLESLDSLQYFVENIKAKGINAVNLDIKKEDGTVPYHVNGQTDSVMLGQNQIELQIGDIIAMLHENGLYVSGTIACFKDSLAASTFVNYALKSASDLMKWEDSGGSLWLSAYSEGARDYITGILEDAAKLGFDEIILSWFFFPNVANEASVIYEDEVSGFAKPSAVKDFVTSQRRALDQIAPRVKLGLEIPLQYFLNVPNEKMGLAPSDLAEWCNFFSTSFAPSGVAKGSVINGETFADPENSPFETAKALCAHFKYMTDNVYFRPYLQAYGGYGEGQITNQKQALLDSGIN